MESPIAILKRYLVEVLFFLFKTGECLLDVTVRPYIVTAVCEEQINIAASVCNDLNRFPVLEERVHSAAAYHIIAYRLLTSLPGFFLGFVCGAYSDKYGRKPLMIFPNIGSMLGALIYIFSRVFTDYKLPLILLGSALQGVFGRSAVANAGVYSYLVDTTKPDERTRRFAVLIAVNYMALVTGSVLSGAIQDLLSIDYVFLFSELLYVLAIVIATFAVKDTVTENNETSFSLTNLFNLSNVKDSLSVLTKPRSVRCIINTLFWMSIINESLEFGRISVMALFVIKSPLNWKYSWYSYLVTVDCATTAVSLFLLLPITLHVPVLKDCTIIIFGLICKIVRASWMGFSTVSWMMFASTAIGSLGGMIHSTFRSTLSKYVDSTEVGKLFALKSSFEGIGKLVGEAILLEVYKDTMSFLPGLAFMIVALFYFGMVLILLSMIRELK